MVSVRLLTVGSMRTRFPVLKGLGQALTRGPVADIAVEVNTNVENIGARRLSTVMERILDEVSFTASDQGNQTLVIDADYVREHIGDLAKNADLSKFIL